MDSSSASSDDNPSDELEVSVEPEIVPLHPDGDAILVIPGTDRDSKFLVSSAVLRIASPIFNVLLASSDFKEGADVQQGLCPEIPLEGDDPAAMQVLLSILHFKNPQEYFQLKARTIAKVAAHCDKYDCIEAMRPWISIWLSEKNEVAAKEVGLLLFAAFNFRSSSAFEHLSCIAITGVGLETAVKWPKDELMRSIPDELLDSLTSQRTKLLNRLQETLYNVLGQFTSLEEFNMCGKTCGECKVYTSQRPDEYGHVDSTQMPDAPDKWCTPTGRVQEYIALMGQVGLWPPVRAFQRYTAADILDRFRKASNKHDCEGGASCPLSEGLSSLQRKGQRYVDKIDGLTADDVPSIEWL